MLRSVWVSLVLLFFGSGPALAAYAPAAADRGFLSLAWDAHESGLFEEALSYLTEIDERSPVAAEATWLKAECLFDLDRYSEAVQVLESAVAASLPDRDPFLIDIFWEWIWEATSREDYADALRIVATGRAALPDEPTLEAFGAATRFRAALAEALVGGQTRVDLPSGESASLSVTDEPPGGSGWVRAYPWDLNIDWVPQTTLEDWMPGLALRLRRAGQALWIRVPMDRIGLSAEAEARRFRLAVQPRDTGWSVRLGELEVFLSAAEWAFRAAAEGLGVQGAAISAMMSARENLHAGDALAAWVGGHRGCLAVNHFGGLLRIRSPDTGRFVDLDPVVWGPAFATEGGEWEELWADIQLELARPARPYRCFCGRQAVLREVLVADPGPFAVFERGSGFAVIVLALCRQHQQHVTADLMREWGVGPREVAERARFDAATNPWDLAFERGEGQGAGCVTLEGEGVSGLVRRPGLLLGALEAVDGVDVRGRSVRVLAPSASTLIACSTSDAAADTAATRALLAAGRRGEAVSRLRYRSTVRLPQKGIGSFRLTPVE